jgi:two-component system, NarL family, response regulator DesR
VAAAPIRVLLVEDNDIYRASLELLLGMQEELEIVGSVGDGALAATACESVRADVVLMDFRLPGADGAEATSALRSTCPQSAVVCLTAEASEVEREAVLAAGAVGLVEKAQPVEELVDAIRRAAGRSTAWS